MPTDTKCPACGKPVPAQAQRCPACNAILSQDRTTNITPTKSSEGAKRGLLGGLSDLVDDLFGKTTPAATPMTSSQLPTVKLQKADPGTQPERWNLQTERRAIPKPPDAKKVGSEISYFCVRDVWPLERSHYYRVLSRRCAACNYTNPSGSYETCAKCNTRLPLYLMVELCPVRPLIDPAARQELIDLSLEKAPAIWQHEVIFDANQTMYLLLKDSPKPFQPLINSLPVKDPAQIIQWCVELGKGLEWLHSRQYVFYDSQVLLQPAEAVMLVDNHAFWGSLLSCLPYALFQDTKTLQARDVRCLAQVAYVLYTGSAAEKEAPPPMPSAIEGGLNGAYGDIAAFLKALTQPPQTAQTSSSRRSLSQLAAIRTDVGKKRTNNEDFVGKYSLSLAQKPGDSEEVGLYIVSDGMGGHQAGEKASDSVSRLVVSEIQTKLKRINAAPHLTQSTLHLDQKLTPAEALKQAVQVANASLNETRQKTDSNRGATINAALIIGNRCTIANVGDSRAYLLRGGKLQQISEDHSLVAVMLKAGMIKPEEVRTNPSRNQITRAMGEKPDVEVDTYDLQLAHGDRLLLCSDGLWEMVTDDRLETMLRQAPDPVTACDQLIDAANDSGGADNITAIVIWME